MFTVALIGGDGAGKTTIAEKLLASFPMPIKYMYMGIHIPSSNIALPTSRLAYFLKLYSYRRSLKDSKISEPQSESAHRPEYRRVNRGKIGATARLLNRMAEECYRQLISWIYQRRGYIVVYDRHFIFDYDLSITGNIQQQNEPRTDRLHRWFLKNLYPQPDLVIFLDVPPDVLLKRKKEWTIDYLQKWRKVYLEQGKHVANFTLVDATQPLDRVYADVTHQIRQFHASRCIEKTHRNNQEAQT